jgi:hypothetical protein
MRFYIEAEAVLKAARELEKWPDRIVLAQRRALGTLRRRWPVMARRDIQAEYALKAQRIRNDLSVRTTEDSIRLIGAARGLGLRHFAMHQDKHGVRYTVFAGQRRRRDGGFIKERHGIAVAFERLRKPDGTRVRRYPLQRLYGPSVAQMLRKRERPERLGQAGLDLIAAELQRLLLRPRRT